MNSTFASPAANADYAAPIMDATGGGLLSSVYNGINGWSVVITLLLTLVAYDQCELFPRLHHI